MIELIVASALVMLLMGEVWMLLKAGGQFYLRVRGQTEVQKNALISLRWLSKDLAEGAPLSFRHYDPDNPSVTTTRNGLVFGSPKNLQEKVSYGDKGRLMWASVLGYYIDPETKNLYRTRMMLPEMRSRAPQIEDTLYHVDLMAEIPTKRLIARQAFDIETEQGTQNVLVRLRFRDEKLGFGLSVQTRLEMKNK